MRTRDVTYNITQGETAAQETQGRGRLGGGEAGAEEGGAGEGVDETEVGNEGRARSQGCLISV